jgi:hypothetical protein
MNNLLLQGRIALLTLLALCLACNGCTTLRPVDISSVVTRQSLPAVKPGEGVEITLKSGERKEFRVVAVTAEGLQGKNAYVAYTDIALLEVRKVSAARVAAIIVGVAAVLAAIAIASLRDALNDYD